MAKQIEMRQHKVNGVELRQAYCIYEQKWQGATECNPRNCGLIAAWKREPYGVWCNWEPPKFEGGK